MRQETDWNESILGTLSAHVPRPSSVLPWATLNSIHQVSSVLPVLTVQRAEPG